MSQNRNLLDLAASGKPVEFRQAFNAQMNSKMAERIVFSAPAETTPTTTPVVEGAENSENVIVEDEDKESKKKGKLSNDEKKIAKKAFEDGKKTGENEAKGKSSDLFIFGASEQGIVKAKEVVANYNDSHPDNELEVRVYRGDKETKFFVSGEKIGRLQVKNLISGVGGTYQSQKV